MSQTVTATTFAQLVLESPMPILVDFYAPGCAPCRMLEPIIDQFAHDLAHLVRVVSINIDEEPGLAATYQIDAVPTLVLITNGTEMGRRVGFKPTPAIRRFALQAAAQA